MCGSAVRRRTAAGRGRWCGAACGVPEICPACELRRCATRQRQAMMIAGVPPSALSDLHPGLRLAGPARPLIGAGKRGTAGAAARGRRAAPRHSAAPAGLTDRAVLAALIRLLPGRLRVAPPPGHRKWTCPRRTGRQPASDEIAALTGGPPPRTTPGGTNRSRASCSSSATGSARPRSAGCSGRCGSRRLRGGAPIRAGGSSSTRVPRRCLPPASFT
jgi:hypothetical protein